MEQVKTPWYSSYDGVREHLEYPDYSIYLLLEESAKKREGLTAYNYFGKTATYKEFLEQIDSAARAFLQMGVKPKDIISICMPNTPEALISFYAINKIGAVANMIHPLSAENEIKYYVNLTESKIIVTIDLALNKIIHILSETKLEKIIQVSVADSMPVPISVGYYVKKGRKLHFEKCDINIKWTDFIKSGKQYTGETLCKPDKNDTAAILYSGGTSGKPKGIELTDLNFNSCAIQARDAIDEEFRVGLSCLGCMPIFHGFGLGINIHAIMMHGVCCVLMPTFNPKSYADMLIRKKPNIIAGVPTIFEALLHIPELEGFDMSFLIGMFSGGDTLSVELKHKIDKFLDEHNAGIQVREGYGLTECVTASCLTPKNTFKDGSIGIPFKDTVYAIVKPDTDEVVPNGEEGEIIMRGPSVMKGYLNNELENEKTLRRLADGNIWLYTGDLGRMDDDGYVYFSQRIKRMIISNGYNIYPGQIENVIDGCEEVAYSCVIGVKDPRRMQRVRAYVVLNEGYEPSEETKMSIMEQLAVHVASYALPKEIIFKESMPKTLVGKVAFRVLEEEAEKELAETSGQEVTDL